MRKLTVALVLLLIWLQYTLWFGQSGHFAKLRLQEQVAERHARVNLLTRRNEMLAAQVKALKADAHLVESKARSDLGLIKPGEVFYLMPDDA